MGEQLHELLQHCTAIVAVRGKPGSGSGFFVAPGLLLTCEHVVRSAHFSPEAIEVFWKNQPDQASNEKIDVDADWMKAPYKVSHVRVIGDVDLALLQVEITTNHPCVWLSKEETSPDDELYNFGYPVRDYSTRSRGEPANYSLEGKTDDALGWLKFKGAHIMKGQSGSPLLSKRSGYVCAVVKSRFDPDEPFGGLAISAATVLQVFPELETQQQLFHRTDQRWMDCLWENTGLPKNDPRLRLLQSVRKSWIKEFLEKHLGKTAYILLGLSELPEAIENPLRLPSQEADQSERGLPLHTTITQVYDQSIDGSLLILGDPGGGKTTMLLELARNLLERTRRDSLRNPPSEPSNRHPIPVVFKLSSWAVRQRPLADWLIEELHHIYGMSPTQSKSWIESNKVLPLLDGLDEVGQNALTECVKAINTYRQKYNSLPTVVCCNRDAYLSQPEPALLQMHCAVVVQPLTTEQINKCLESAGPQLEGLRIARLNDPVMQELLTTPLMLNILMAIFGDIADDEDLLTSGPIEKQRQQIIAKYVQRMSEPQIANSRYTSTQAIHWLSYLAKQLDREGPKELFSVENLQPSWLRNANKFLYHVYNWCIGAIYGLVFGLPVIWLAGGFQPSSFVTWLVLGLISGILYPIRSIRIRPIEAITWSWKGLGSGLVIGTVIGTVIGWVIAIGISLAGIAASGLSIAISNVRAAGPTEGAISALFFGIIFGLFRGLFPKQLIVRTNRLPNSGIRRSMKNGLVIGFLLCPIIGTIVAFVLWWLLAYFPDIPIYDQYYELQIDLVLGLASGLYIGLIFAMFKGLGSFVQHYLLRFLLWCTDCLPWNLMHFLDEAARRHLLSKVGGNYIFWHESLLKYFATLDEPASTEPKKASFFHRKPKLSLIGRLFTGPIPDPVSRLRLAGQITLRVLLALLIIGTVVTLSTYWSLLQADRAPTSSTSLPDSAIPTSIESSPQVTINSTSLPFRGTIREFSPLPQGVPITGMVIGPDGNLWFADSAASEELNSLIGFITPSGQITEFVLTDDAPGGITAGPDGNLWFIEDDHVGRITPSGKITEFALPTDGQSTDGQAFGITKGPDGNLWFTEGGVDKIGRITPTGKITEFTLPTKPGNGSGPYGITAGPDGNLWFTEVYGNAIGRITPTGKITEFALPPDHSGPDGITAGPDGNLWFTEVYGNAIGRITPTGKITEFALPPDQVRPAEITAGPDGNLWFPLGDQIGRITPTGKITEFTLPSYEGTTLGIGGILFGPKAHLWFSDDDNFVIGYMTSTQF